MGYMLGPPPKMDFCELVTFQLILELKSDMGDNLHSKAPVFTHNSASDMVTIEEFDKQCQVLRQQLAAYLQRRAKRKEQWTG